jgi:hypothetical protein
MPDTNPFAVELLEEQSCSWQEADVPLPERGVRFSWLCNFVRSIYWQKNQVVEEQKELQKAALAWEEHARWSMDDLPTPDIYKGLDLERPVPAYDATIGDLVAERVLPLTNTIRAPLYARIPPSDRGKPEVFLSHAWANSVLSSVPQWHGGTLDAFDSQGIAGITEKFVWIDFVCYNQHAVASDTIAFDVEAIIRSIGNVAFAVTMTPLFDRIWCLWEVLSVLQTGAKSRFCVGPGYQTDKRVMVNKFFEAFKSVEQARSTKTGDYDKLLAAMISRFGSIAAADEHIRKLMSAEMGNSWFGLYSENR